MNYLNKIFLLLTICIVCSCEYCLEEIFRDRTTRTIVHYLESVSTDDRDTCRIDLRKALKVDYDSLFIFCEYTRDEDISKILGRPYKSPIFSYLSDSHNRIVLFKNDKIAYQNVFYDSEIEFDRVTQRIDDSYSWFLIHYSPYYYIKKIPSRDSHYHPNHYRLAVSANKDSLYIYKWDRDYENSNAFRLLEKDDKYPW